LQEQRNDAQADDVERFHFHGFVFQNGLFEGEELCDSMGCEGLF
jgi:hypothetical protein